jgi:dUTP pyrophosphatase
MALKKIKVVLEEGAIMPTRAHATDAGLDLYSREWAMVNACSDWFFDTGVRVEIPEGYMGAIMSKSGLNKDFHMTCTGVIDAGYTGTIGVTLRNHSRDDHMVIRAGRKIAQLVIVPIETPELELVDSLEDTERGEGGFGSTGEF